MGQEAGMGQPSSLLAMDLYQRDFRLGADTLSLSLQQTLRITNLTKTELYAKTVEYCSSDSTHR
jgi:hypothetical protein